ncbi:MAG: isopentenyl-diphosphate Delta-isomerase [Paludibacter sp.]|nr:isopentenyl-diphosphate Delta-isomerase [Paludibacter sp.]
MENEFVILVDEHDHETGFMEKMEAHKKALMHRAVSVFILNTNGDWLLQRRALSKYHSGGLWTNTCCTHPLPNETNNDAANRRLSQEMGLQSDLTELFSFIYKEALDNELTEHELDHVFSGISDLAPQLNPDEVVDYKYISFTELNTDVKANPENYTVWFRKIYENVELQISKTEIK